MMHWRILKTMVPLSSVIVLTACGSGTGADGGEAGGREEVTLTSLTAIDREAREYDGWWRFVELLEDEAPWVTIEYRGATETIPFNEQAEAVANGAFDITVNHEPYYEHLLPIAPAIKLSPFLPEEERTNGVYDIYTEEHAKIGLHYLGRVGAGSSFRMFVNEELESPDLSGLTLRSSPAYVPMIEGNGGSVVEMSVEDTYTALQRRAVDGLGWSELSVIEYGLHEVVDYEIPVRFFQNSTHVLMNPETWEGLDEETQEALTDAMIQAEIEAADIYAKAAAEQEDAWREAGVQPLEWSESDVETYLDRGYEAAWATALEASDRAQELQDIFSEERFGSE